MDTLIPLQVSSFCSLYEISGDNGASTTPFRRYIASSPETQRICNDPFVVGVEYTNGLRTACTKVFQALEAQKRLLLAEPRTTVLHILRGGLNFGLREALNGAFGWNRHSSAFVSAQRARRSDNPEDWYITESAYQKVFLPPVVDICFGDVVATGTSLEYALCQLLEIVQAQGAAIRSVTFFTIGGPRSEDIVSSVDATCRSRFEQYEGSAVVYLEGRFSVATPETRMTIKYTGTDLLRTEALLAPEFLESQQSNPAYPIERCTIYDAGSRAFWLPEYLEDVQDYWEKTAVLAEDGMTYRKLLGERMPELGMNRFDGVDLRTVCRSQLARCSSLLKACH